VWHLQLPSAVTELGTSLADMKMENLSTTSMSVSLRFFGDLCIDVDGAVLWCSEKARRLTASSKPKLVSVGGASRLYDSNW